MIFKYLLVLFFSVTSLYSQENLGFKKKEALKVNELEIFTEKFFKDKQFNSNHTLVVLFKDEETFFKVYPEHSNSFTELTRFHSRVLQEVFTTFTILQLKESEKLNLQGDIYNHKIRYDRNFKQNILIENVLAHTTGIHENIIYSNLDNTYDLEFWKLAPLIRYSEPNEFIGYSLDNLQIQRTIVQDVTGKNPEEFIKDSLLAKLNLENTSFENSKLFVNGKDIEKIIPIFVSLGELEAKEILKRETWQEVLQENIRLEDKLPGSVLGFFEHYENKIWGYSRVNDFNQVSEELIFFPKENSSLYIYADSYNPQLRREFIAEFLDTFYKVDKTKIKRDKSPGYAEYLKNFEGDYAAVQISSQNISKFRMYTSSIHITQDNGMLILESGKMEPYGDLDGRLEFIETEPFLFRSPDREIYISFKMNEAGDVEYLLSGSGQHGAYKKLSTKETKAFHEYLAYFFFGFYCLNFLLLIVEFLYVFIMKISVIPNNLRNNVQVFLWLESILALILFGSFAYFVDHYDLTQSYEYIIEGNAFDYTIFTLPFGFIAGMSLFTYYALRATIERRLNLYKQIQVGLFLLVSIFFIYWMTYWNLLTYLR